MSQLEAESPAEFAKRFVSGITPNDSPEQIEDDLRAMLLQREERRAASHTAQESRGEWTHEPPTVEGWYWKRFAKDIVNNDGKLCADGWGPPSPALINDQSGLMTSKPGSAGYINLQWWSIPIAVPQTVNVEEER